MASLRAFLRAGVVIAATVTVANSAKAQCVQFVGTYTASHAASIGVHVGSGWSVAPPIASAIGMWDCNGNMGLNFPTFLDGAAGEMNVYVHRLSGRIPQDGAGCARFVPDLGPYNTIRGGDIEIYAEDSGGNDCSWALPHVVLDNIIAHELGHALTLANSTCGGYLMGPDYPTSGTHPDECDAADGCWLTPSEEEQENCDLQCSQPCTGSPPSCPDDTVDPACSDRCTLQCPCSPLVLDLNGDGIHTTNVDDDPVFFDFTGDLLVDRGGWTNPHTEEGILYYDRNRNRTIDGADELFGQMTVTHDGSRANDGFAALAGYDDPKNGGNGDGVISPADRVWGRMRIWVDRDHDGVMTNDENYSVGEQHIVQVNLAHAEAGAGDAYGLDANGNYHRLQGTFIRRAPGQGRIVRSLHDVYFMVKPLLAPLQDE